MYLTENEQLSFLKKLLGISGTGEDELLESLLEMSTNIALVNLYPFAQHFEDLELPVQYHFWVVMAAKELYENKDVNQTFKSYSENGLSYTLNDTVSMLSQNLLSQLIPKASVPK